MKKLLLMFIGMLTAFPTFARDFTYEYEGQTLTYTVIDEAAKTVMTKEGFFYPLEIVYQETLVSLHK